MAEGNPRAEVQAFARTVVQTRTLYKDSCSDMDPEDADHIRVLELINEFLPVNEFAGRIVRVNVLREFGLVGNQHVDNVLAAAFSTSPVKVPS